MPESGVAQEPGRIPPGIVEAERQRGESASPFLSRFDLFSPIAGRRGLRFPAMAQQGRTQRNEAPGFSAVLFPWMLWLYLPLPRVLCFPMHRRRPRQKSPAVGAVPALSSRRLPPAGFLGLPPLFRGREGECRCRERRPAYRCLVPP